MAISPPPSDRSGAPFIRAFRMSGSSSRLRFQIRHELGKRLLIRIVVLPVAEVGNEIFANLAGGIFSRVGIEALPIAQSFEGREPDGEQNAPLVADLALANDDQEAAAAEADKAIALENDALDAMAIHAALERCARAFSRPRGVDDAVDSDVASAQTSSFSHRAGQRRSAREASLKRMISYGQAAFLPPSTLRHA